MLSTATYCYFIVILVEEQGFITQTPGTLKNCEVFLAIRCKLDRFSIMLKMFTPMERSYLQIK